MRRLPSNLLRFARHKSGSVTISFGLMAIFLFGIIGAALDYGKWHNASQHLGATMDTALLAAGRQLQTEPDEASKAIEMAKLYFDKEINAGVKVDAPVVQFTIVDDGMGLEGKVVGSVKTPFLGLLNIRQLDVVRTAKVAFNTGGGSGSSDLEVALMLDVTESMCDNGIGPCTAGAKMEAMKSAAKDLVKIVLGSNSSKNTSRVAIVPFSTRVRVDEETSSNAGAIMKKVTNLDPVFNGWHNDCSSWSGSGTAGANSESAGTGNWTCDSWLATKVNWKVLPCVTDRTGPDEFTDAPPSSNAWLNGSDGNRAPLSWDSSDTPVTTQSGTSAADPYGGWNYTPDGLCWDVTAPNYVLPLTSDIDAANQRIDAMEGYGSTAGALGTAWAWYLISPNWDNVWGSASKPGPYGDLLPAAGDGAPKLRKIAVLMTDGDYNTYRAWKDYDPVYVANNAKAICTNMKAQGIEIFTVGFDLDSLPATQRSRAIDTLQSCGTDISHFYNSMDPAQLKTAFRDIALKLSELYVAK